MEADFHQCDTHMAMFVNVTTEMYEQCEDAYTYLWRLIFTGMTPIWLFLCMSPEKYYHCGVMMLMVKVTYVPLVICRG